MGGSMKDKKRLVIKNKGGNDYTEINGIVYKIANTKKEREESFKLVYDSYLKAGLIPENQSGLRVVSHHLNPMTDIFIAKRNDTIIYTVTLITDDSYGLPTEIIFSQEINHIREKTNCIAEMSCLAGGLNKNDKKESFEIYVNLISLIVQFSRHNDIDCLILAVHPKHARFYSRFFGCNPYGKTKEYSTVQNNPATLCIHNFLESDIAKYKMYDRMYKQTYSEWELLRQPMTTDERNYFSSFLSKESCLKTHSI